MWKPQKPFYNGQNHTKNLLNFNQIAQASQWSHLQQLIFYKMNWQATGQHFEAFSQHCFGYLYVTVCTICVVPFVILTIYLCILRCRLRSLILMGSHNTGSNWESNEYSLIGNLKYLQRLVFQNELLHGSQLSFFNQMLESLWILDCPFLSQLPPITSTSLAELRITSRDSVQCFPDLLDQQEDTRPNIQHLHIEVAEWCAFILQIPEIFQNLQSLLLTSSIHDDNINSSFVNLLAKHCPNIRNLLFRRGAQFSRLSIFAQFHHLELLSVTNVTGTLEVEDVVALGTKCPNLRHISPRYYSVFLWTEELIHAAAVHWKHLDFITLDSSVEFTSAVLQDLASFDRITVELSACVVCHIGCAFCFFCSLVLKLSFVHVLAPFLCSLVKSYLYLICNCCHNIL